MLKRRSQRASCSLEIVLEAFLHWQRMEGVAMDSMRGASAVDGRRWTSVLLVGKRPNIPQVSAVRCDLLGRCGTARFPRLQLVRTGTPRAVARALGGKK